MDIETFKRLITRTNLTPVSCRMAKSVLVDGLPYRQAARLAGRKPHESEKAARRILREFLAEGQYPRDWVVVTVAVPQITADLVLAMAETAAWKYTRPDAQRSPVSDAGSTDNYDPINS